jgi:hypothetical protein
MLFVVISAGTECALPLPQLSLHANIVGQAVMTMTSMASPTVTATAMISTPV